MEQRLTRALRTLPLRSAPAALEGRVLDELARRASLPWWQRGFAQWPAAARIAFGVACLALVALSGMGAAALADFGTHGVSHSMWAPLLREASVFFVLAKTLNISVAPLLSSSWVVKGLIAGTALYAALFGLAIAGYRALYLQSEIEVRS
jgi:hypothetical protein